MCGLGSTIGSLKAFGLQEDSSKTCKNVLNNP